MVSIDTCLPPNYPYGDVHRCQLRFVVSSQALMLGSGVCVNSGGAPSPPPNYSINPLQQITHPCAYTERQRSQM